MGLWDGFKDGVKHNLSQGVDIGKAAAVKAGNGIADALNLPQKPEDDKKPQAETFDWALYIGAGVSLLALGLVVFFKFGR